MRSRRCLSALAAIMLLAACERQPPRSSAPPSAPSAAASVPAATPSTAAPPSAPMPSAALVDACPATMAAVAGDSFDAGARRGVVAVAAFCMDRTEVAVDAYAACVKAGSCSDAHVDGWTSDGTSFVAEPNCNYGKPGRDRQPMNCVDWKQAASYCAAQGARLPTEAEWEWAARGGARGSRYPWGNDVPSAGVCWSLKGQPQRSASCAVGTSATDASPLGVLDLAGNLHEWTSTAYAEGARVVRGGSFLDAFELEGRANARRGASPASKGVAIGFRCAVGRR